jgi:hypothetical protein
MTTFSTLGPADHEGFTAADEGVCEHCGRTDAPQPRVMWGGEKACAPCLADGIRYATQHVADGDAAYMTTVGLPRLMATTEVLIAMMGWNDEVYRCRRELDAMNREAAREDMRADDGDEWTADAMDKRLGPVTATDRLRDLHGIGKGEESCEVVDDDDGHDCDE